MGAARTDRPHDGDTSDAVPQHEITLRIVRRPLPGHGDAFEEVLAKAVDAASHAPGYLGAHILSPGRGRSAYTVLVRFDGPASLRAWMSSPEHDRWLGRLDAASEDTRITNITGTAQERPLAIALTPLEQFVRNSVSGIGLLLLGAFLALILANTPLVDTYERFWNTTLAITAGHYGVTETLRNWINDLLMALFFFIVGLEIKRQVLVGEMQHPPLAWLAVAAALGGVIVPALIYAGINTAWNGHPGGWGIPVGTDTAFALGLLTIFGNRVPSPLLAFVAAFSIVDDILAVLVIAIFYTASINWDALGIAAVLLAALGVANSAGIQRWPIYAVLGLGVWLAIFDSGIHSTLAGILVAMTIPARAWIHPTEFITRGELVIEDFKDAWSPGSTTLSSDEMAQAAQRLEELSKAVETPMTHLNHVLSPWVNYGILPLFAFANAGIPLFKDLDVALTSPVTWGVALGLLVGKPIGITLASYLAVRFGPAALPHQVSWANLGGVGLLGGIGFTMSLFVTSLAFPPGPLADAARIGMLIASILAGIASYLVLDRELPAQAADAASA